MPNDFWKPKGNTWKPRAGGKSKAEQGLDRKMNYWDEKDYQSEFGITVGASLNLAYSQNPKASPDELLEIMLMLFKVSLAAKTDQRFIDVFKEYYPNKLKKHDQVGRSNDAPTGSLPVIQITKT